MTRRARILGFGSAALLVIAGAVCAAAVGDGTGEVLALVLIGLGFVAATSLVFLEVGLSEDHERAREEARERAREEARKQRGRPEHKEGGSRPQQGGSRLRRAPLDRMRGRPRRLR
jgi:hypothetical protein